MRNVRESLKTAGCHKDKLTNEVSLIYKKGQIFLIVLILLFIVGILAGGIARVLQAEKKIIVSREQGIAAFYLAQAGLERAKIELIYYHASSLPSPDNYPYTSPWTNDELYTSDSDGTYDRTVSGYNIEDYYVYRYRFTIDAGRTDDERVLKGEGEVLDHNGTSIAQREMNMKIKGIDDADGNGVDDTPPPSGEIIPWSWQEI